MMKHCAAETRIIMEGSIESLGPLRAQSVVLGRDKSDQSKGTIIINDGTSHERITEGKAIGK